MSRLVGSRSCAIFQSSCDRNSFLRFHLCTQDPQEEHTPAARRVGFLAV